jgi:hypothetical protein
MSDDLSFLDIDTEQRIEALKAWASNHPHVEWRGGDVWAKRPSDLMPLCAEVIERIEGKSHHHQVHALGKLVEYIEQDMQARGRRYGDAEALDHARTCYRNQLLCHWLDELETLQKPDWRALWAIYDKSKEAERRFCELTRNNTWRQWEDAEQAMRRARAIYDRSGRLYFGLKLQPRRFYIDNVLYHIPKPRGERPKKNRQDYRNATIARVRASYDRQHRRK